MSMCRHTEDWRAADMTDLTQLLWAQYMDVLENGQQIGLVDVTGQARPSWHAFHFYAQMPTERVVSPSSLSSLLNLI